MDSEKRQITKFVSSLKDVIRTEKVSVNMNSAALAQIDLLVDKGYYSNRSDFITQAVNNAIQEKRTVIDDVVSSKKTNSNKFFIGITKLNRNDFEEWKYQGQRVRLSGYGTLVLENGCDELILETVESIRVVGTVYCSERLRKVYLPNY